MARHHLDTFLNFTSSTDGFFRKWRDTESFFSLKPLSICALESHMCVYHTAHLEIHQHLYLYGRVIISLSLIPLNHLRVYSDSKPHSVRTSSQSHLMIMNWDTSNNVYRKALDIKHEEHKLRDCTHQRRLFCPSVHVSQEDLKSREMCNDLINILH